MAAYGAMEAYTILIKPNKKMIVKGNITDQDTQQAIPGLHVYESDFAGKVMGNATACDASGNFELEITLPDGYITFSHQSYGQDVRKFSDIQAATVFHIKEKAQELSEATVSPNLPNSGWLIFGGILVGGSVLYKLLK